MAKHILLLVGLSLGLVCCGCASLRQPADPVPAPAAPDSLRVGETNIVAMAVPPPASGPQQTLPQFLGIDTVCGAVGEGLFRVCSRIRTDLGLVGKFPGLQPKPPVVPITDPANLDEKASPAVKVAAKVKADEDQAAQKVQALRYLGTVGCSDCYPEVEDALLAALDDCTEAVRYEAIKAIRGQASGACECCASGGCCSAKVQQKLNSILNDVDPAGRRVETSERILRQVRLVLQSCGPPVVPDRPTTPLEGPSSKPEAEAPPAMAQAGAEVQPASYQARSLNFASPDLQVAFVDGQPIEAGELEDSIQSQLQELGKDSLQQLSNSVRQSLLQHAIQQVIDQRLKQAAFLQTLEEDRDWDPAMTPRMESWFREQLGSIQPVSESRINDYYQQRPHEFRIPASFKWEQAMISVAHPSQFRDSYRALESMRATANGEGMDASLEDSQIDIRTESVDWTSIDEIENRALAEALQATAVGKTSEVIRVDDRLVLLRVLGRKEEGRQALSEARREIRAKLAILQQRQVERQWLDRAREPVSIWTILDGQPPQADATPIFDDAGHESQPRQADRIPHEVPASQPGELVRPANHEMKDIAGLGDPLEITRRPIGTGLQQPGTDGSDASR